MVLFKIEGKTEKERKLAFSLVLRSFGNRWQKLKHKSLLTWESIPVEYTIQNTDPLLFADGQVGHVFITLTGIYFITGQGYITRLGVYPMPMYIAGPSSVYNYEEIAANAAHKVIKQQRRLMRRLSGTSRHLIVDADHNPQCNSRHTIFATLPGTQFQTPWHIGFSTYAAVAEDITYAFNEKLYKGMVRKC